MRMTVRIVVGAFVVVVAAAQLAAQGLIANAGPDQSGMFVGTTVNLNGSGSTGATTFLWAFTKRPTGSAAVLQNPATATPSFVPDRVGAYTVRLTVGNGTTTTTDTVIITTGNRPPIANAGPNVSGGVGKTLILNRLGSTDPDNSKLTYSWSIVSAPRRAPAH